MRLATAGLGTARLVRARSRPFKEARGDAPASPRARKPTTEETVSRNATLLGACLDQIADPAWWYFRLVEHYIDVFLLAGGGDLSGDAD